MKTNDRTAPAGVTGLAATVVLLRAGAQRAPGVEVLLLERPHDRGSFAGAWVFPGGAVDPEELPAGHGPAGRGPLELTLTEEEAASRRAAVRETREETGLVLQAAQLAPLSRWHPPREAPKRLRTWFWLAAAPAGPITVAPDEAVGHRWLSPDAALAQHARGELRLFPPTWLTLHGLLGATSVAALLQRARGSERAEFATRMLPGGGMTVWPPDVAYGQDAADPARIDAPGPRNRLDMRELPWRYLRAG
ncbi:NUDIX hydrolase [Microterricola pindariensis]|uniref:Nudix hydrolase domain-containing protein n=1 Tax=Microterricola pindariensis TaxID=478010 RepID=A0ABX5B017_9MICO|nr:NUDIX hydrolase [Microterricola pindariensis]PPL19959.1 hypothetical protein GY24_03345 [Microterricola pindariensis]